MYFLSVVYRIFSKTETLKDELGYEWIEAFRATRGNEFPKQIPTKSILFSLLFSLESSQMLVWFVTRLLEIILTIGLALILTWVSKYIPGIQNRINSEVFTGNLLIFVLVTGTITTVGVAYWRFCEHRKNHSEMLEYRAQYHELAHKIRNKFCSADYTLDQRIEKSNIEQRFKEFMQTDYDSNTSLKNGKATIIEKHFDGCCNELLSELVVFFSSVCDEIAELFEHVSPKENLGCCIRTSTYRVQKCSSTDKFIRVQEYRTVGRSNALDNREGKTTPIASTSGIAKIISEGGGSTGNCILLVKSIKRAVELKVWDPQPNDDDRSIRSVVIFPIKYRRQTPITDSSPSVRIDGLLYITSGKDGKDSPFSADYVKSIADVGGSIADFLACINHRLHQRILLVDNLRNEVEQRKNLKEKNVT